MRHFLLAALLALLSMSAVPATAGSITPTPTITPGGPTTFCEGGSVTLTSSSATGNQWFLNANPIGGATNQAYIATASGNYTVVATTTGIPSLPSAPVTVTVNPIPPTPTITQGGPTALPPGGSVTLTSSAASGNQWYLSGNPIGGATNQTYIATAGGDYTVTVTTGGCTSAASAPITVTGIPVFDVAGAGSPGGTISCASPVLLGDTTTCTVTPDTGRQIVLISGCGGTPSGSSPFTTGPITADCTVTAVFSATVIPTLQDTVLAALALLLAGAAWLRLRRRS